MMATLRANERANERATYIGMEFYIRATGSCEHGDVAGNLVSIVSHLLGDYGQN
jgi:hypothetical protein